MNRLFPPEDDSVGSIHDQLVHLTEIRAEMPLSLGAGQILTRDRLANLIEAAYWASLRANEGRTIRVCVAFATKQEFQDAVALLTPVAYDESQIVKLAPAVPRDGFLAVSAINADLQIWGFGRIGPGSWLDAVTIEISEPGTLRVGVGPFQPFAVLNGRSASIIAGTQTNFAHFLQRVLQKVLPANELFETQAVWRECMAFGDLARMIVAEGHGGTVLIVPSETGPWAESLNPFAYRFAHPDTKVRDRIRREVNESRTHGELLPQIWQANFPDSFKQIVSDALSQRRRPSELDVHAIASLAGVDGAIVMTRDLGVLGFGAKIAVGTGQQPCVCKFGPEPGSQGAVASPMESVGGTRHQSAARFAAAHQDTVALVFSQDRYMTLMHWHQPIDAVAVIRNAEWWI
jgi:hypothetical protein